MFQDYLDQVEKPSRYLGDELNAIIKDPRAVALKVALAYPDFYEVGMSNTGIGSASPTLARVPRTREGLLPDRPRRVPTWPRNGQVPVIRPHREG